MKILYIANIRLPTTKAHGIQIMKTCEALARQGADVSLVVTSRHTDVLEDPFVYYRVEPIFKIYYGYCPNLLSWGKLGFFIMNIVFSQVCAQYVWRLKPDIVYSRDYFLLFDQFIFPQRKVWEVHDGIWNWMVKFMRVSGIVAISKGLKSFYEKRGKQNIIVAHDGVDLKEFEMVVKKKSDLNTVMYIGHLYGWKGLDTFIKAANFVSGAQFVVIGGTNSEVEKLKQQHPNITFLGYKPYNELPQNQQQADILVIPNSGKSDISRLYTSPLKVFSYMTSGVPILASDLPSLREVLNENNAYFAEADNAESFGIKIKEILSNREKAKAVAEQAQLDAKKYSWDNRAQTILDFLKSRQVE